MPGTGRRHAVQPKAARQKDALRRLCKAPTGPCHHPPNRASVYRAAVYRAGPLPGTIPAAPFRPADRGPPARNRAGHCRHHTALPIGSAIPNRCPIGQPHQAVPFPPPFPPASIEAGPQALRIRSAVPAGHRRRPPPRAPARNRAGAAPPDTVQPIGCTVPGTISGRHHSLAPLPAGETVLAFASTNRAAKGRRHAAPSFDGTIPGATLAVAYPSASSHLPGS